MATVPVRVMLGAPGIEHAARELRLALHIMNVGEQALERLHVTAVTLTNAPGNGGGAALRTSPVAFPIVLSTLGAGAVAHLAVRFSSAALVVGSKVLLTLTGSYVQGGASYGLTLNRYLEVPPAGAAAVPALAARLVSTTATNYWNYTLSNDETAASGLHVATLALSVAAPVTVTGTPPGWTVETDNMTYVLWRADDYLPPYPRQIAPGQSLGGFQLMSARTRSEATPAVLTAWNHALDDAGPVLADYALTPYRYA